ncbi:unnamed protein product [Taenia asiatica]|uniref:Protein kinase domain-containing protein n=1 Tax=Taenia asiatica TaxID=60517 RepID=A0A0R3VYZ0_TAEAS|nr:unnamed protein product [Taenia asiatica]
MDYSVSRQFGGRRGEEDDDDVECDEENEEDEDDDRRYGEGVDDTDPSTQLRRTQKYSRQKLLNDSEVDDEQELDNLGVDEEMPEQDQYDHDAMDDQSVDLRKTAYARTSGTPMRPLGMYPMNTAANHRFEGHNRDGLGEVLEDLGCIARHSAVAKRETSLYPQVDVAEQRNGEVDVCSRRSSAAATPSHGPVPLPSMAALASSSTSPADLAPGSGRANHGQIGPASAASASTMSPLVSGLGGTNQRPPSRPLAHQTSVPECSQVTSPILHYPPSSAGMHCNPPSVGGLGGMGPWSESSYGSSSQEAYKQAPPNVFLHASPNTTSLQYRQQQQHPESLSPEFHHLQREQLMPSTSPSQRMLSSNPYLAHQQQQQHHHQQATPPSVSAAGDAVDHLRSLSALGAKYTQPLSEPIDLGEQRDTHPTPVPMLGSGCGMPPTSLGSLLSGKALDSSIPTTLETPSCIPPGVNRVKTPEDSSGWCAIASTVDFFSLRQAMGVVVVSRAELWTRFATSPALSLSHDQLGSQ